MEEILRDLEEVLEAVPPADTDEFLDTIVAARRVFMYGLGRSGLVARMFGMRLVQLGQEATIVGDTTTPAIRADDLLVICSRTGRSPILRHAVGLGHKEDAKAVAVVGMAETALARAADLVVRLPVESVASAHQPMGSLFEQALLLYLDATVMRLMRKLGITVEEMQEIHSNLP